jgi:hypothetical protein
MFNIAKDSNRFHQRSDVTTLIFRYKYTGVLRRDKIRTLPRSESDHRLAQPPGIYTDNRPSSGQTLNGNDPEVLDPGEDKCSTPAIALPQERLTHATQDPNVRTSYRFKRWLLRTATNDPQGLPELVKGLHGDIDLFIRNERARAEEERLRVPFKKFPLFSG